VLPVPELEAFLGARGEEEVHAVRQAMERGEVQGRLPVVVLGRFMARERRMNPPLLECLMSKDLPSG
jgi:hypothetical protein